MLSALASSGVVTGLPAAEASGYARRALADERLLRDLIPYGGASRALTWTEQFADAGPAQAVGLAEAQRRGSAPMFMHASTVCSVTSLRLGELDQAEDHAQRAYELARETGSTHFAAMFLLPILAERGRLEEARAILDSLSLGEPMLRVWQGVGVLAERGRVRIASGELEAGVADALEADRRMSDAGCHLSILVEWVGVTTGALDRLGRRDEATAVARRELDQAIAFGVPRRRAIALTACGALDDGPAGLIQLQEAAALLSESPARLARARALVELGVALRRRGESVAAREPLGAGLDLAHRCGAVALAELARAELVATGARPRRASLSGPGSLTPAELRTAEMAASGMSNRDIAQALFVSTKTVETQLSQAYAKLRIGSRSELAQALTGPGGQNLGGGARKDQGLS
jgi:DNA-binding CsgD family transcriptional regulator